MINYTNNFQGGYSCKFSPFRQDLIACCFNQHYGIVGNGKILVLAYDLMRNSITPINQFNTNKATFDITFSEDSPNILASIGADGQIRIYNIDTKSDRPISILPGHTGYGMSINWSHLISNTISTSGSDGFVKITDVFQGKTVTDIHVSAGICYSSTWHPTLPNIIGITSSDGSFILNDIKNSTNKPIKAFKFNTEVLHCDFNKFKPYISLAHNDGSITIHDLRGVSSSPVRSYFCHKLSCVKSLFSPFVSDTLVSVSFDMNLNVYDINSQSQPRSFCHHREFIHGVDFSLFSEGVIGSIGWDGKLCIFNYNDGYI